MADENLSQGAEQGPAWYQPAEVLKETNPDVWTSFENGIKSGSIKDLPSLVVKGISAEKRLGAALVPPGKDAKPEEVQAFREKLYATGHVAKPQAIPESPDAYEIKFQTIGESAIDPALAGEFRQWAHESGLSQEQLAKGVAIYEKQFGVFADLASGSVEEANTRIAALVASDGKDMNAVMEAGKRAANAMFKDSPKTIEKINKFFGNDADIAYAFAKMGEALGEDASQLGDGTNPNDSAFDDIKRIRTDPQHPEHKAWLAENGRGPINEKIAAAYNRKFPGKIDLT